MNTVLLAHPGAGGLDSWVPLLVLLGGFSALVTGLVAFGRPASRGPLVARFVARIPDALERATRIPGWAAAAAGTALYGLLIAGIGFYEDVAWHIAFGRDEELFTAPHTMIVVGLGFIFASALVGILFATVTGAGTRLRLRGLRVPWSTLVLGLLGGSALVGFPLDEAWHHFYGVDVTMWSPTHMLMILGASLSPLAAWLVLAEAGVRPSDGAWSRFAHALAAWLTLAGLSSSQGEFNFGVPQFQQLYLPVLVLLAGAGALTAARIVLGRGWALGIALVSVGLDVGGFMSATSGPVDIRRGGFYVGAAVAIELVAWIFGTERRTRFAIASGLGVASLGFGTEWWWNAGAHQPWTTALLPDAILVGALVAFGAAVLGTVLGTAISHRDRGMPGWLVGAGAAAVVLALVIPFPRQVGDVHADVRLEAADGVADVRVTLDPPDAAADARWFQTISWQGGGLVLAEMQEVSPGSFVTSRPVPITGTWKTLIRLHRGAELMTVPVYMPADPEIDWPGIPAADRSEAFRGEQQYLMPEVTPGPGWFASAVYALLTVIAGLWALAFAVTAARVRHADPVRAPRPRPVPYSEDAQGARRSRERLDRPV